MKAWSALLVCAATLAAAGDLRAAPGGVWRCGADGRSYGDRPCPEGVQVDVADPRSADQVRAARAAAAREQASVARLTKEREAAQQRAAAEQRELARLAARREVVAAQAAQAASAAGAAQALRVARAHAPAAPRHLRSSRPEDDGIWRAVVPVTPRRKG